MDQGMSVGNRFRLTSHVFLGLVIAIGNSPAWMHAGNCSHMHSFSTADHSDTVSCAESVCHHHEILSSDDPSLRWVGATHDSKSHHDADHCILCQSLGSRESGMATDCDFATVHRVIDVANLRSSNSPQSHLDRVPHPRGPPSLWG